MPRDGTFPRAAAHTIACNLLSTVLLCLTGCASIHSEAVRTLIEIEHKKVSDTKVKAKAFREQTDARVSSLETAVDRFDSSLQNLKKEEAKHALVFSSNQNLSTKRGVDAHAVAYLIGRIYVSDQLGLEQQVKDQFTADFAALKKLSKDIDESWTAIEELQGKVLEYSKRSGIASIDPEFVKAVLEEASIDTSSLDEVIKRSKKVNVVLKESFGTTGGQQTSAPATRTLEDVIDFLEKIR